MANGGEAQPGVDSVRSRGPCENNTVLDGTIQQPAAVTIKIEGAFIIDEERLDKQLQDEDGISQDTRDIRLPQHSTIVSHVAVDVSVSFR